MSTGEILQMRMPADGESVTVHLRPHEVLKLAGATLDGLAIDILGPDVIFTDAARGAKMVFPGLALILFSEEEKPEIEIGGVAVSPDMLLSKIGVVQNITQKDFLTFTSLQTSSGEKESTEEESVTSDVPVVTEAQYETVQMQLAEALKAAEAQKNAQPAPEEDDNEIESIIEERATLTKDASGAPAAPVVNSRSSDMNNTSSATATEEEVAEDTADSGVRTTFDFGLLLLQVQSYDDTDANTFEGGGGSQLSAFNPSNALQYSTEIIDTVSAAATTTVYADEPDFFTEDTIARVIQVSPNLPSGFEVTTVSITVSAGSLPAGFTVVGVIDDTGDNNILYPAVSGGGGFTITDAAGLTLNDLGNLDLVVTYTAGATAPVFELSLDVTSTFDVMSGYDVPDELELSYEYLQKFMVKDVSSSADLVETDGDDTVYVLSTTPNANYITTSDSDMTIYSGGGVDTIEAGGGDDVIYGTAGNDVIDGGGNGADSGVNAQGDAGDTLDYSARDEAISVDMGSGATYNVTIDGGTYTDSVTNIENITGSTADDTIYGDSGDNILRGDDGDDVLMGRDGDDTLDGGADDVAGDTVSYAYVVGGTGVTVDLDGTGSASVTVGAGDVDSLIDIENITGTDFDDTFFGSAEDNVLDGGGGTDTVSYAEAGVSGVVVDLGANGDGDGVATDDGGGSGGQDSLLNIENVTGSDGDDSITGDGGDNIIQGGLGDDVLDGAGSGDTDTLSFADLTVGTVTLDLANRTADYSTDGSQDSFSNFERYVLTGQGDIVYNSTGDDVVDGGGGTDTINYSLSEAVDVDLEAGTASVNGAGGGALAIGSDTLTNFEDVVGSGYDDIISGTDQANSMSGGAGDDVLMGRGGVDALDGGTGTNTASYAEAAAGVSVDLDTGGGAGAASDDGDGGTDTLLNIQNVTGSAYDDSLTGDGNANVLTGGDGDDTLDGAGGDDTLYGGNDDDILAGRAGDDILDGGAGSNDIANYSMIGSAITVDFTDPAPDIQVTNDGEGGSDTLIAIEEIRGSQASDSFIMDDVAIAIDGQGGDSDSADYTALGASDLTVYLSGVDFQIYGSSGSVQNLTDIERLTTGDGDDTIYGSNSENDNITTGNGDNYVYGSTGYDTIVFGSGNDTIDYSLVSTPIASMTLDASGNGTISRGGAGIDSFTSVENIIGSTSGDTITGNSQVNYLGGGTGDDTLDGGTGNDFLDGGSGVDTVSYALRTDATGGISFDLTVIDAATDPFGNGGYVAITLNGAGETDYVKSMNVIHGTDDNDVMTGDASTNYFYGRMGADTMDGGDGVDRLFGGDGLDDIVGGSGDDLIYGGNDADTIDGGADNDTIYGDSGDDIIDGGANDDIIVGGSGADNIDGNTGTDTLDYASEGGGGAVTVNLATGSATDSYGDTDTLAGIENVEGTSLDDTIYGDGLVNDLQGNAGDDVLSGGEGNDVIDGGADEDTIDYSSSVESGGGAITIDLSSSTNNATDTFGDTDSVTNVENVIGTSLDDTMTGSSADNTLTGGGGDDTFYASTGDDTILGQGGTGDIVDYTTFGGYVSGGFIVSSNSGTIIKSTGGTDSISGVEYFQLSDNDDVLSITNSAVSSLAAESVLGGSGSDRILLSEYGVSDNLSDLDIDGDTLANVFSDIEEIDLSSVTLTGPDQFDMTSADVLGIAGAGGTLTLTVASGFDLNLDAGSGNVFAGTSDTFDMGNGTSVVVQVV